MRKIGIIILLVLCLTLLLLTGCVVNTIIPETACENLENQENTEEPVIENTEEPAKWSGLGMGLFSTANTSEFNGYVDDLLANGFTELRMNFDWYNWESKPTSEIISAITKGAQVIWGVESGNVTLTSFNWNDYADAVKAAALWAQTNGVYEFQIGNEEDSHIDGTISEVQLRDNLKSLATEVKTIFTRGNVSYTCAQWAIDDWISSGKGDIDILTSNIYMGGEGEERDWQTQIDNLLTGFGIDGTYITEFAPDCTSLDHYSTDEAIQATAVTEMIEYIKSSGITRAFYFCYKDPYWLSGFGVRKDDGTYRLLWNQALLNSESVKFATIPTKTTTASLPNTIALIPK